MVKNDLTDRGEEGEKTKPQTLRESGDGMPWGIIQTSRLTIRPIHRQDWRAIKIIRKDFEATPYRWYDAPFEGSDAELERRIGMWEVFSDGREHFFMGVCLGKELIGYFTFHKRESPMEVSPLMEESSLAAGMRREEESPGKIASCLEMGYAFRTAYQGQGFAREALTAIKAFFYGKGVRWLVAGTALHNDPSVRFLYGCSFSLVGLEKVSFYQDAYGEDIFFDGGVFACELGTKG